MAATKISSQEVNYLVWRYLEKEGLALSSAALDEEVHASHIKSENLGQNDLVSLLLKGLQLQNLESSSLSSSESFESERRFRAGKSENADDIIPAATINDRTTTVTHLPTGNTAIGCWTGKVLIVEGISDSPKQVLEPSASDGQVTLMSPGPALAVGYYAGSVKIWDSLGQLVKFLDLHRAPIISLSWSPDNQLLASADCNNTIAIWHPATGELKRRTTVAPESLTHVEWIDLRTYAIVQSIALAVFKLDNDAPIVQFLGHSKPISCLSFDKSSQLLASGGDDNLVQIWHPRSQAPLRTLSIHDGPITVLRWLPGSVVESLDATKISSHLLSAGVDGKIALWDLNNPEQPVWVIDRLSAVMLLEVSPKHDFIAAGTASELMIFSVGSGQRPQCLGSHVNHGLQDMSWSDNLAAASLEGAAIFSKII